jgi:diacylglycerol kinase (ATP)
LVEILRYAPAANDPSRGFCNVATVDSILLLSNVRAGSADDEKLDAAVAVLRASATVELCVSSGPDELDDILDRLGRRRLVVAGGDGSLHGVVAALNRRNELKQAVLGLIPVGTGNDFARAVGIPLDPEAAARALLAGGVRPIDLVFDDAGNVVVNNVRVGIGAEASRQASEWKKRLGRIGYAVGAVHATLRPPIVRLLIVVDEEVLADVDRPVLDISIGNGATVGGGVPVNPAADPQSGQMDVMLSFAVGPVARLSYGIDLLRSRHLARKDVVHRRGDTVSISGSPFWLSSDGEVSGPISDRTWRVEKSAFQMTLP